MGSRPHPLNPGNFQILPSLLELNAKSSAMAARLCMNVTHAA